MPDLFEIIAGTYEQYLLGYKISNTDNVSKQVPFRCYILGYVRCMELTSVEYNFIFY